MAFPGKKVTPVPDQEFLVSYGVKIDEGGVSRLQSLLSQNRALAEGLSASFEAASESIEAFKKEIFANFPSLFSGYGIVTENLFGSAGGLKIGLDMTEPRKEISSFIADVKKPIALSANASAVVSAARTALENVRSLFSETFILNIRAGTGVDSRTDDGPRSGGREESGSAFLRMSSGGRFTKPTDVQVAEDGETEYIIPVKKEGKALPLLRRLLGELSPAARESLSLSSRAGRGISSSGFNILPTEAEGSLAHLPGLSAGQPAAGGITNNNNNNLSAPVTINVNARGADAEQIGRTIYDTAERYLVRTLEGVMG